jgi:hypothetical protein
MPTLLINNFSGGLSSGSKIGLAGSFRFGRGLDIHTDPDILKVSPASTKDSGSVVVDLPVFGASNTTNSNLYFLGNAGNLYKKASGTYTKIATYTTGQGMGFFNGTGKVIFCSGDREYKLDPASDAITAGRVLDTADWHPVEAFRDKVFIGNGREIISTDGSGIDYDSDTIGGGITLEYGQTVWCMRNIGDWLFIGCASDNSSLATYYLWDGFSADFNYSKKLKGEDGINAIDVSDDGSVIISAGKSGHLYQLTGLDTTLTNIKTFPLIENDKTIEIYPQAMTNYKGRVMMGLSTGTSLTAERGVYSWASHSTQYSKTLNLEYAISTETTTGTTTQIGLVFCPNTTDLYVGWADNGVYGIDLIDGSGVQATAIYESLIHDNQKPHIRKFYNNFKVNLAKELATGEVITCYYKKDHGSWTSMGTIDYSVDGTVFEKTFKPASQIKARDLEFKMVITNSSTTAPEIDSVAIEFEEEKFI